jgi:lipopolysaccharide exporter
MVVEQDGQSIGRKMAKGSIVMVLLRIATRSLALVSTIILARVLVPADFGLVALATVVMGLLQVLGQLGFNLSLIKDHNAPREKYDTAWTLHILRGILTALILLAVAPFAANFFGDPRLKTILYVLALVPLIDGLRNIGVVDFRKYLRFGAVFRLRFYTQVAGAIASITCAVIFQNYWALIVGSIVTAVFSVALSYRMHDFRPRLTLQYWRDILHLSKWVLTSNILVYLNNKSAVLVLGKLLGAEILGEFTIANRISTIASTEVTSPATRSLLPGFSKVADDRPRLAELFVSAFALLLLAGLPVAVGVMCFGELLVRVVFGEKWLGAVPFLEILAIFGIIRVAIGNSAGVFVATDNAHYMTMLSAIRFAAMVPLMTWGYLSAGAYGVAWAVVASALLRLVLNIVTLSRILQLSRFELVAPLWRTIAAVTVMAGVLLLTRAIWPIEVAMVPMMGQLIAFILIGALTYFLALLALWAASGFPKQAEWQVIVAARHGWARFGPA